MVYVCIDLRKLIKYTVARNYEKESVSANCHWTKMIAGVFMWLLNM